MRTVLHAVRDFSPYTETFIYDLLLSLSGCDDLDNRVVCFRRRLLVEERPYEGVVATDDLRAKYLKLPRLQSLLRRRKSGTISVARYIDETQPDLIHCHFAWAYFRYLQPVFRTMSNRIPMLISFHGTDAMRVSREKQWCHSLIRLPQERPCLFSATTPFLVSLLEELGVSRELIRIIPNAVNPVFLRVSEGRASRAGQRFRILCNARMVPIKGHRFLLEAFSKFVSHVDRTAELGLVGDGELRASIVKQIDELGLGRQVILYGNVRHADLPGILSVHDVYVQPSIIDEETGQQEAFGIAALEAIAAGLPAIVTNTGGLPYLVGKEGPHAILVPPADANAIFYALQTFYERGAHLTSNAAYASERVAQYSPQRQLSACREAYRDLCSRA